jgi:hypothetical protein
MKINNENGFALITALMITMICLVITMGILTIVIQNIRSGGIKKSYQNAVEASYGGAELQMYEIVPKLLTDFFATGTISTSEGLLVATAAFGGANPHLVFNRINNTDACLIAKLSSVPSAWPAACNSTAIATLTDPDPTNTPDFTLTLPGTTGQSFTVQSKIVDTSVGVPYMPAPPGGPMNSNGSTGPGGNGTSTLVAHYVYRIEVSAARTTNPMERGAVSVLYEY